MSATRSTNLQPQQRLDLPSIKLIESSSNYDLDLLAGVSLAGKYPVVFKGLVLNATNVIGTKPEFLTLSVANSVIWHYLASESGTIFQINSTEPDQVLSSSNPNVSGTFTGGMNYVGIDLYKTPDSSTSDTAAFLDADTEEEFNQVIPLARTIKYKIIITSQPFSVASHVLPIAKVLVTSGTITSITDARNMMFRLGSGGDNPNSDNVFGWGSRTENPITITSNTSPSPFSGEDKNIGSLKDWMNSVMSSIWEIRGGTKWYSQQNRDNVKLAYGQPVLSNGDNLWFLNGVAVTSALSRSGSTVTVTLNNHPFATAGSKFELNSTDTVNFPSGVKTVTNITGLNTFEYTEAGPTTTSGAGSTIINTVAWTGLNLLFENSNSPLIYSNIINSSSLVVPDSHAIYVDLDRSSNAAITPAVKPMYLLGGSAIPGRRIILAWRNGAYVYTKDRPYEAGRTFLAATTTALGLVKINQTAGTPAAPVVPVIMSDGEIRVTGTTAGANYAAAWLTGASSSTSGTSGGGGSVSTGGNGLVAGANGGNGGAGIGGLAVSGFDGVGYFGSSRNSSGLYGSVLSTGTGVGGWFTGKAGESIATMWGWLSYLQNIGVVAKGSANRPGLVAIGDLTAGAGVVNYLDSFGLYFKGKSGTAGAVGEVNGNAPGLVLINNKYGLVPAIPTTAGVSGHLLWLNTDNDNNIGVKVESDFGHTGDLVNLKRLTGSDSTILRVVNEDLASTKPLIKLENNTADSTPIEIDGGGSLGAKKGIKLSNYARLRLGSGNEKITYDVSPTYTAYGSAQDAAYDATATTYPTAGKWVLAMGYRYQDGTLRGDNSTTLPPYLLVYRIRVPKKANISLIRVFCYNNFGGPATLRTTVFCMQSDTVAFTRTPRYLNTGGATGDTTSVPASLSQQAPAIPFVSGSINDNEDLYVGVGKDGANAIEIGGVHVEYTLPEITGSFS